MERREFLEILAASLAGAGLGLNGPVSNTLHPGSARKDFYAWVWFHASRPNDRAYWRRRFAELREAGITGVLVEGSLGECCVARVQVERDHRDGDDTGPGRSFA